MKSGGAAASSRNGYLVFRERIPDNLIWPSGDSRGETPVPIPNTEVKPSSADGSWGQRPCKGRSLLGGKQSTSLCMTRNGVLFLPFIVY